jgi:hypothetical protein
MNQAGSDNEFEWKWEDTSGWKSYNSHENQLIESAFRKKQKTVKIGKGVVVHFNDNTERSEKRKRSIKREVKQNTHQKMDSLVHAKKLLELLEYESDQNLTYALKEALQTFIHCKEYVPPPVKEYVPTRGVDADEFYDITSQLDDGPITSWSQEQINNTIKRVREVGCYFMRGTPKAKQALEKFHREWSDYVSSNPTVRALLDPEIIVFDVNWAPPVNWPIAVGHANQNLGAPMIGVPIPPAPVVALPGLPTVPVSGVSDIVFSNPGPSTDANHFGGFVVGANIANARGYWRITSPAAPVYY